MKQLSLVTGHVAYPTAFQALWETFPARLGARPKAPAMVAYQRALKLASAAVIQAAAEAYRDSLPAEMDRRFIPMLSTWINQARWEQYAEEQASKAPTETAGGQIDYARYLPRYLSHGSWPLSIARPGYPGCPIPKEVLERFGIDWRTGRGK